MNLFYSDKFKVGVLSLTMMACSTCITNAQTKSSDGQLAYPQQVMPVGMDNFHFSTYYYSGSGVYNLLGKKIGSAVDNIVSLKVNPSGISLATLAKYDGGSLVTVNDLWEANHILHEFYEEDNASAIEYTPDGKQLLIAMPNKLAIYDATYFNNIDQMAMPFEASLLEVSPDGKTLAATKSNHLVIWDFDQKLVFKELETSATVNDIAFSKDNSMMAVLTSDSKLSVYSTSDFRLLHSFSQLGNAAQCSFNTDGKFIAVVVNSQRIVLLNLDDAEYRSYIDNEEGGISNAQFVRDGKGQSYLVYNTFTNIVYKPMDADEASASVNSRGAVGKVVGSDGKPLPGALVEEVGGTQSTITELDGTFGLQSVKNASRLRASYAGMQSKTRGVKSGMTIKLANNGWLNEGPEHYEWIATLQSAFPEGGFSHPSFGAMVGKVKDIGWYVKGVYRPVKSTDGDYTSGRWTTGESKRSYWAATAGAIVRVKGPFHCYVGGGYVDRKVAWELADGSYAKNTDLSYNGATLDYGLMFKMYHVVITGGAMTNLSGDCHFTGCVGVGISF